MKPSTTRSGSDFLDRGEDRLHEGDDAPLRAPARARSAGCRGRPAATGHGQTLEREDQEPRRLIPQATVHVGYSFLYASNVARPGEQINRSINPTQTVAYGNDPPPAVVGAAQPTFNFNTTDFWSQTLSIGLAYRF